MQITMIGHSTVLIEMAGKKILTDPFFGEWGNPAYARLVPPAKTRQELLDVDLVLISHSHWDHVDRRFLSALTKDIPIIVPTRARWLVRLRGAKQLLGLDAWEEKNFGALSVTAVPAAHITISLGYVIQGEGKHIYFAGDTYYRPFMQELGQRFKLDVALIPVTTFRIPMTMGEKSAVRAVQDLKPDIVIPIHLGVNPRTPLLRTNHSPEGFMQRVRNAGLETKIILLKEGDCWMG